jgi:nucleotide-binding universal stress UspA family protein
MNILSFSLEICLTSILAGFLGALTGLGGGVVIVHGLCLLFKMDLHYAIGASLVSVIATLSGAAAAYVRDEYSNIRIDQILEHIRERSIDLLVLGIRKSSHLGMEMRTSRAFQIIVEAECPVLTIRQ